MQAEFKFDRAGSGMYTETEMHNRIIADYICGFHRRLLENRPQLLKKRLTTFISLYSRLYFYQSLKLVSK